MPEAATRPIVCPHARRVEGAAPGLGGVICGVMERDQQRADPILEGAPVGVFISEGDDPSTYMNLCTGQGAPVLDPDELPLREFGMGHYTACPIHVAGMEVTAAERLFAPSDPGESVAAFSGPGADVGELEISDAELRLEE